MNKIPKLIAIFLLMTGIYFMIPNNDCFAEQGNISYKNLLYSFFDASFIDESNGWISGKSGFIYHTEDGGKTWRQQDSGVNDPLFQVKFMNENEGVSVGQHGLVLGTEDGGKTWTRRPTPVKVALLTLDFFDDKHGMAAGDWGKIIATQDGGKNWSDVSLPEDIILYSMQMVGEEEAWAAAETGLLFHTTDGGKTWESTQPTWNTLFGISFDGQGNGMAVGLEGTVVLTHDGGETWTEEVISDRALYNVRMVDGNALVIGDAGTIFAYSGEGADHWKHIPVPPVLSANWLQGLAHLGGNDFFIIGKRGAILVVKNDILVNP